RIDAGELGADAADQLAVALDPDEEDAVLPYDAADRRRVVMKRSADVLDQRPANGISPGPDVGEGQRDLLVRVGGCGGVVAELRPLLGAGGADGGQEDDEDGGARQGGEPRAAPGEARRRPAGGGEGSG